MDIARRYEKLSKAGDPLERLNEAIDWRVFKPTLDKAFKRNKNSNAGRKPFNRLMMFKILVLQQLYNLSDAQMEYQIRDRLSFIRFLGLSLNDNVPDEKTIWLYRETLIQQDCFEALFHLFEHHLEQKGYGAKLGTIIDASLISAPKQRNTRNENLIIKENKIPDIFKQNVFRLRQKDCDARWTLKNGQRYFGYKNHINIDTKHKLIRAFEVTAANTGDIRCFENLLRHNQQDKKVWADSAYYSNKMETRLQQLGFDSRVIPRYMKHLPHDSSVIRENKRRSKIRKRVEHVFGFMENSMHRKFIRTIGLIRAKFKIGMMNLVYNLCRFEQLERLGLA